MTNVKTMRPMAVAVAVWLLGACAQKATTNNGASTTDSAVPLPRGAHAASPEQPPDADIQRLEREARALAQAEGCAKDADCRTAPLGDRPCGGPRDYLVYCRATTDSAALFAKLDELARAEDSYNETHHLISTCLFRMPPGVTASGGACHAAPVTPMKAP